MLRIALIGAGQPVQIGHAPALQALPELYQVTAICDPSPEALERTGMLLGVAREHWYTEYREMLLAEHLDIVDISLPNAFHHDAAMASLLAGAHLVIERPLSLSAHDAEELLQLAELRGRLISVLHYYLFYPPFREAIRLVREGAIGEPFFIRCEGVTGGFGPGTATYHPRWHDNLIVAGGGVWIESGYHAVYLCTALMRSPVIAVSANINSVSGDFTVDDTAVVHLTHENDGVSCIQVAWSIPAGGQRVFEIYGADGAIAMDHEGYPLGLFSNVTRTWQHPVVAMEQAESYIDLFKAIAESVSFGAPPPVSHRDALHALLVVQAGYRASAQNLVQGLTD